MMRCCNLKLNSGAAQKVSSAGNSSKKTKGIFSTLSPPQIDVISNSYSRIWGWTVIQVMNQSKNYPKISNYIVNYFLFSKVLDNIPNGTKTSFRSTDALNVKNWESLFEAALEMGNISVALELLEYQSLEDLSEGNRLIEKFWTLFGNELKNNKNSKQLIEFLFLNLRKNRMTSKVYFDLIQTFKNQYQNDRTTLSTRLSELLSLAVRNEELIADDDLFDLIQFLQESVCSNIQFYPRFELISLPRNIILPVWDRLFEKALASDSMGDVLFQLCLIKPLNDHCDPKVEKFWNWVVQKASQTKSNRYFYNACNCAVPLNEAIAFKVTETMFQEIEKEKNISDSDVHFMDDMAWDCGRVDSAARERVKSRNILPKLRNLIDLLLVLKTNIDLGKYKEDHVFKTSVLRLKDQLMIPYLNKRIPMERGLIEKIQALGIEIFSQKVSQKGENMTEKNACDLLGLNVAESKSKSKIGEAYRKKALENHPDLVGSSSNSKMQRINAAKDLLMSNISLSSLKEKGDFK